MSKLCKVCNQPGKFYKPKTGRPWNICRDCCRSIGKVPPDETNRAENLAKSDRTLRNHGMVASDYDSLLAQQNGCCPTCKAAEPISKRFRVVKSKAGKPLFLLCHRCATLFGMARGDSLMLRRMINLMELYKSDEPYNASS